MSNFRRLVQEQQKSQNKINSPLTRNTGQLSCVVCNCNVKNELLWNAHVLSKKHKESVARFKCQSKNTQTKYFTEDKQKEEKKTFQFAKPEQPASKRKQRDNLEHPSIDKKSRADEEAVIRHSSESLPVDFFDDETNGVKRKSTEDGLDPLAGKYTKEEEEEIEDEKKDTDNSRSNPRDQGVLPEGFFDDPVADAAVRQVEYKPKIDVQYELFQKEIAKEEQKSEAIIEEDDEEAQLARDTLEVVEQLVCEEKIDVLKKARQIMKEKQLLAASTLTKFKSDSDSEESEDDFFDWRAKKA